MKLHMYGVEEYGSILQCDDRTITRGLQALNAELSNESSRAHQSGASRKLMLGTAEGQEDAFLEAIKVLAHQRWPNHSNGHTKGRC